MKEELFCPICGAGRDKLTGPYDHSEDGGVEDWWCDECVDFIPPPQKRRPQKPPTWADYDY